MSKKWYFTISSCICREYWCNCLSSFWEEKGDFNYVISFVVPKIHVNSFFFN